MAGNKKISDLLSAGTLDGTELVEVVQGGVNVRTTTNFLTVLASGITGLGTPNHLLYVKTVVGADGTAILTVESGDIEENSAQISGTKNGDVTSWSLAASSSDDNSSFKVSSIHNVNDLNNSHASLEYIDSNAEINNFFKVDSEHCKIQSEDVPLGSDGALVVDVNGNIVVSGGVDGSFEDKNGLVITVTKGIITSIV